MSSRYNVAQHNYSRSSSSRSSVMAAWSSHGYRLRSDLQWFVSSILRQARCDAIVSWSARNCFGMLSSSLMPGLLLFLNHADISRADSEGELMPLQMFGNRNPSHRVHRSVSPPKSNLRNLSQIFFTRASSLCHFELSWCKVPPLPIFTLKILFPIISLIAVRFYQYLSASDMNAQSFEHNNCQPQRRFNETFLFWNHLSSTTAFPSQWLLIEFLVIIKKF